jgi:type IV pilus assembly protein PilQ
MIRVSHIGPQARRRLAVCLAPWALLLALIAPGATAQDVPARNAPPLTIEAITGALHPGSEVVRIDLSRALQVLPASFAVQSPARIALDLPGAVNALGRQVVDIQQGHVRTVQVVQSGERTRLVINLKAPVPYALQVDGRSLLVVMTPMAAPLSATTSSSSASARTSTGTSPTFSPTSSGSASTRPCWAASWMALLSRKILWSPCIG